MLQLDVGTDHRTRIAELLAINKERGRLLAHDFSVAEQRLRAALPSLRTCELRTDS